MKKLNLAVAFALSLAAPFGAMAASDDATIRAMGMNDIAAAAVMKDIAISGNANANAQGNVDNANKNRARGNIEFEQEEVVVAENDTGGNEDPDDTDNTSDDDVVLRIR